MAVSNIYVYCGEGGLTVSDVNRLTDSLHKNRQWESHDGISLVSLTVITNEPDEVFYQPVKTVAHKDQYGGFWNNIECYKQGVADLHDEDKVIVITSPLLVHDLSGIPLLEHAPVQGKTENAAQNIDEEDKELIKDKMLCPIQQFTNWYNDDTDYIPHYLGVPAGTARIIYQKLTDNIDELKSDYDATPCGLQQFIECELEEQLFWLNDAKGICVPYAICDKEKQLERNELWESNVRPWFVDNPPDGYGWRGLGGEQESLLYEFDHEYRTISRQVSFITFEGNTDNILDDEFARWWIL
tara:strand:- start:118 stop:1011 length:894 start_codon:yes stop_codon:yes gene_type:complete